MFWPFTRKPRPAAPLRTARLELVPITPALLAAEQQGNEPLAQALQANVTPEWPPEHWDPHVHDFILKQFADHPDTIGYHRYILLSEPNGDRTLVGCTGSFPKPEGDVELGYSTLPSYQRRGYATEAVNALITWLFTRKDIRSISAQTYPTLPESIKVMQRCGLTPAGPGDEPDTLRYRRMR